MITCFLLIMEKFQKDQNKLKEAELLYYKAIELKPDIADQYSKYFNEELWTIVKST